MRRLVKHLFQFGSLNTLYCPFHWIWNYEEADTFESVVIFIQIPKCDNSEIFAVLEYGVWLFLLWKLS